MDCTWKGEGEREGGTKPRGRTRVRAELPVRFSNLADTDVARAASCVPLLQGTPPKYRPWLLPILASDGRRPSICRSLSLALFSPRTYSEARHAELSSRTRTGLRKWALIGSGGGLVLLSRTSCRSRRLLSTHTVQASSQVPLHGRPPGSVLEHQLSFEYSPARYSLRQRSL